MFPVKPVTRLNVRGNTTLVSLITRTCIIRAMVSRRFFSTLPSKNQFHRIRLHLRVDFPITFLESTKKNRQENADNDLRFFVGHHENYVLTTIINKRVNGLNLRRYIF